jgi:hypothetical protein
MAFKSLVNQSSEQLAHKIHGLIQLYKNKHHLYVIATGMGRTRILASAIADTLSSGHKVYLLVNSNKEDTLLRIAAALSDLEYKDLKNPTYRNKPEVQEKLKQISEQYDSNIEVDTYFNGISSKQVVQQISEKHRNGFDFQYVFIEDIGLMADENEYAKQMNQTVSNLNSLAEAIGVSIVSCSSVASTSDIPGYLLNQDSSMVMFSDPPYKGRPDFVVWTKSGHQFLLEMKGNMRVGKTGVMLDILKKLKPDADLSKSYIFFDESHSQDKTNTYKNLLKETLVDVQTTGRFLRMSATPCVHNRLEKAVVLKEDLETQLKKTEVDWSKIEKIAQELQSLSNKSK